MKLTSSHIWALGTAMCLLFIVPGCSTKKTGWAHTTYHSILTRFNGYFNAKEIMKASEVSMDISMPDDYMRQLPIFKELKAEDVELVSADMDIVVEKCAKVVRKNSIKKRGKEHTKWIDDCYLLMGKAFYYKHEDGKAYKLLNQAAKKYPDQESKYEARFWLARLYVRQQNYDKALRLLSFLESEKEITDELRVEVHKLNAEIFLRENNVEQAIDELRRSISLAKKKEERLRLTYLLGQLLKEEGERAESMQQFRNVLKMHPEYKMEFYTRIQMAMAFSAETGGAEEVRKELMKMLKDEKYIEFRDQIYYALAEMAYAEDDIEETIHYLNLSTEVSDGNDYQKATSFLRLGEIYFAEPEYVKAQANYDSCVTYLTEDYPQSDDIKMLANNLKDLVAQIMIIDNQDSLQRVAKMDEEERAELIQDIIDARIEEEERKIAEEKARAEAQAGAMDGGADFDGGASPRGPGGFGGPSSMANKWYFYNPTVREAGASEFKRKWGARKNEDDWRRSSKEQQFDDLSAALDDGNEDAGFVVTENGDTLQISGDWLEPSYYMKDLPLTPEAVEESNNQIIEAYYALAIIYKEQMEDVPMSIETLEELLNRFNPNVHSVDSYYRLYRMNEDEGNADRATYYKNKILNEYPNSQYAKVILDPNFLERENEDYVKASKLYEKAYLKYYSRGYYVMTIEVCDEVIKLYGDTRIEPKARFLRALAIGHENGEEALRSELNAIAGKYPKEEYGIKAQELLASLDIKKQDALKAQQEAEEQQRLEQEVLNMDYKYEPNSMHNFVILVDLKGKALIDFKRAVSDFNRTNHKTKGLKMSAVVYGKGLQMITVKKFTNAKDAKAYANSFINNSKLKSTVSKSPFHFIISFTNYALFYKDKSHESYKMWSVLKYKDL